MEHSLKFVQIDDLNFWVVQHLHAYVLPLSFSFFVIIILSSQLHGQNQMQFSQSLGGQQFQGRQLPSGAIQHGIAQSQLNQGNQLTRHLNQMSSTANSALFNDAQATPNSQMVSY